MRHLHAPGLQTAHQHNHTNGGHHHVHKQPERRRLAASMVLTGVTMLLELAGGIIANSLALVSDAAHMFTHLFALGTSLFAIILAARPAPIEKSFGFYRAEILAAFTNGLLLLAVTVYILYESVVRFLAPRPIAEMQMIVIALIGLAVNLVSAMLLAGVGKGDLNIRSAFLHMVGDTLSSIAVVGGALLIHFTGWLRVDPILSGIIALMIGIWSYRLLRDSANVLLESTPKHVSAAEIVETLRAHIPQIRGLHDIHVWEITGGMYTMTAHVAVDLHTTIEQMEDLRTRMESLVRQDFRIGHTAFQFESIDSCTQEEIATMSCCTDSPSQRDQPSCCCPPQDQAVADSRTDQHWIVGRVDTPGGQVPQVATRLTWPDRLGTVKVRLNIRRMHYAIEPGLYAVGTPTPHSPVLVSANYKLSFDRLRQELGGLDAWILVLDTKGINVWCAAGKGTFGTDEIVNRIETTGLAKVVSGRTLIVPQLGAPGVAAHHVKKRSGFRVAYGPVRARDLPAFLQAGMRTTTEMRRVRFDLADRLAVVPVEFVQWGRYAILAAACLLLLAGLNRGGYSWQLVMTDGARAALLVLLSLLAGGVLAPLLLPWLPGRAFSIKGAVVGLILACCVIASGWLPTDGTAGKLEIAAWILIMPAIAAFLAMNYTGASTYTSLSGVRREMRFAVPAQIVAATVGLGLWMTARFV